MDSGNINENHLGIKVAGELDDFQIIEENSESDDNDDRTVNLSSRTIDTLSPISSSLVKPSSSPTVCGSVAVTNSENVIIGNNTYFNGPVTIKQIIQNTAGLENPSYVKSEDNEGPTTQNNQDSKYESTIKTFRIQKWHKITLSAICIIILGGIFAILSIVISHNSQDNVSSSVTTDKDGSTASKYTRVVGQCHDNLPIIIFTIILASLTFLLMLYYTILIMDRSATKKRRHVIIDDNNSSLKHVRRGETPLIIAPDHLRIVRRTDWLAQPVENELDKIIQPVPWVIISHTATESCSIQSECVLRVRLIQMFHIESKKWSDIGYNFLVAGDGSAYFGRGWDYIGAHTLGYNRYSIGISFIGTFNNEPPPQKQLDACKKLIQRGVDSGKLAKDYKLFVHRQLASTLSPGDKLCDIIKEWPHFVQNFTDISELLPDY